MEKKSLKEKLKKINIIDLIAVIIIALVALVVLWKVVDKLLPDQQEKPGGAVSSTETPGASSGEDKPSKDETDQKEESLVYVTYTVLAKNQAAELYETVREQLPCQLVESGTPREGWVVDVKKEPAKVLSANGTWVEDPDHVDLLLTVEATVSSTEVMTTLVGTQEVRIGDPGYDLTTQYLEFMDTTVVDAKWDGWDFGADRESIIAGDLLKKGLAPVTFVVRAENRPAELYNTIQRYIPGRLMASGVLLYANVIAVEREPVMVLAADGTWVEDPEHVTMLFTVEGFAFDYNAKSPMVGNQEIRLGRGKYTLKTEHLEIRSTVVTDIRWGIRADGEGIGK